MSYQSASSRLRRDIYHDLTDVLADTDFQSVLLIVLIGLMITTCIGSALPLDDNAINAIALLG
jgi:hypothetical protein